MRNEVLMQILDLCKNAHPGDVFRTGLSDFEYRTNEMGRTIKVRTFTAPDGRSVTEELSYCDYKDFSTMTLDELHEYYSELEDQYDECEALEADNTEDDDYERWQGDLSEIEDEMECVMDRIHELNGDN